MRILPTLACCGLSVAASAADLALRGGYERYGDDYTLKTALGDSDRHWDHSNGYFLGLTGKLPVVPLLQLGVYALYRERSEDAAPVSLDYTSWGARAEAGLALPLVPKLLHLELTPFIGVDQAKLKYDVGLGSDSDTDRAVEYGGHVDLVVTAPIVQAGIGGGWSWTSATFTESGTDVKLEESAWLARIFVGLSF